MKHAITAIDIYGHGGELWLDERQLSQDLGVSRTPIRKALRFLEQEGFVRSVPRRGVQVTRKTKSEIRDTITVWAAIEGMAARLAASRATMEQLRALRGLFVAFEDGPSARLTEYSHANMAFHKAVIDTGGCTLMGRLTGAMFMHMRAARAVTMGQDNQAQRSISDHSSIVAALECGNADLAKRLVREHTLGLAVHVGKHEASLDGDFRQASVKARSFLQGSATWQSRGGRRCPADQHDYATSVQI